MKAKLSRKELATVEALVKLFDKPLTPKLIKRIQRLTPRESDALMDRRQKQLQRPAGKTK